MKLLTIGFGAGGSEIITALYRKGVKVNKIPLFRCYAVLDSLESLKKTKIDSDNKFYMIPRKRMDIRGILNEILSRHEIIEGSMLITSLDDNFGVSTAVEFGKELKEITDGPVMILGIVPPFEEIGSGILKRRIRMLKESSDVLLLSRHNVNQIVDTLNILARVGEIDLKRRLIGEVVVDTSDIFNTLIGNGFSVFGYSRRNLPLFRFFIRKSSELLAIRTHRMVEMVKEAMRNLSVGGDIETAKSALIIFAGDPNEITMDGIFSCIEIVESVNDGIIVRYGDYPIPKASFISVVILFSGITRFKLEGRI